MPRQSERECWGTKVLRVCGSVCSVWGGAIGFSFVSRPKTIVWEANGVRLCPYRQWWPSGSGIERLASVELLRVNE